MLFFIFSYLIQTPPAEPEPETGFWTYLVCAVSERVAFFLPSSPQGWTLPDLAYQLATSVPFVGSSLILIFTRDLLLTLTLVVGYKLLKILPIKM